MLSILTPAFNESANLERLHARLVKTMATLSVEWEWLVVDDHSRDDTFAIVQYLAKTDPRVRGIRLARNSGSHIAITCGLHHVRGDAALMMASDLQDPPEMLGVLLERWRAGAHVVRAVRRQRSEKIAYAGLAAIYYWIMRHVVGMKEMPDNGADFFLIDRRVIDAFRRMSERNTSVFALITWLGFRQEYVTYDKQPRVAGRSGWTLTRRIKLVVDSVTGFSEAPIRVCSYVGIALLGGAFVTALVRLVWPFGVATLLLSAMVALTGLQLLALGIVGEYVWRALDEARQRPAYFIEQYAGEPVSSEMFVEHR